MPKRKSAIVVGCGRFGSMLARELSLKGYGVTVIDKDPNAFERLDDRFAGYTVTADGSRAGVLKSCGVLSASTVVVATDRDNVNIMTAEIASAIFGVENVYARLDDDAKADLLIPFNVDPICPHRLCLAEFQALEGFEDKEVGL